MATLPFFLLLTLSALLPASHGSGDVAIYWGQDSREGTLADACATGLYSYAIIAFLNVFGAGRTPSLNLAGHCNPSSPGSCSAIGAHVKTCQSTNVKVFLALGGAIGNYSLSSSADAQGVADYPGRRAPGPSAPPPSSTASTWPSWSGDPTTTTSWRGT